MTQSHETATVDPYLTGVMPAPGLERDAHLVGAWLAELVLYGTLADPRVRYALAHGELADLLLVLEDTNPRSPLSHRIPLSPLEAVRQAIAGHPADRYSGVFASTVYERVSAAYTWLTPAFDAPAPGCHRSPETPA